ncbi:CRISPR-associated HD domain protein [Pyrolobus fumarii 1A]|uniref:CRISPR-associated HD domain protein n=1 Tax=Pyrolobus fumarii (strain DSM 11204 / 1A) TaxID=694429 RepID=G0EGK2_PYRF1|nr:CRISPR-associated endonuclease Cas3'' [Pyrolobus fumarii]AEM38376.1 CRISPR-associated HD domain protein [Pyrolobus fumarii 1A]
MWQDTYRGGGVSLYARFECVETSGGYKLVKEVLVEHLVGSAIAACALAKRLGVDQRFAMLAAAVHDIGKVLHNFLNKRRIEDTERRGCESKWRLSFRYHEVLSAAVYGYHMWFHGESSQDSAIVARAVLLHHQGLRGLETRVYLDGLAWISARVAGMKSGERGEFINNMRDVIVEVAESLSRCKVGVEELRPCCEVCKKVSRDVAEDLKHLADTLERVGIEPILEHASTLLPHWASVQEDKAVEARRVSGVLMLADNAVARMHCREESSTRLYPEEARWMIMRSVDIECRREGDTI